MIHEPVLVEEVVRYLNLKKGGVYIDGTLDGGGHAREILKHIGPRGKVLGIERDAELVTYIKKQRIKNLIVEEGNYINMAEFTKKNRLRNIKGILFDFGVSSWHLEESGRGFSFKRDEALDMRFSQKEVTTAAAIVNSYSADDLAKIFISFGEMRNAHALARAIVAERKRGRIITTGPLTEIAIQHIRQSKVHPATKLFQALRIVVNQELEAVHIGLRVAMQLVSPGGRVAAISFHSLEDRIVKNTFRVSGCVVSKKPIGASFEEISRNPRARSAKLRVWERT